ncbi:hypothetical protein HPB51_001154 [Rhipicephalus microplus]|uniref:Uncharacterized protein n=1 Tax=Rhipicephalus microplus TaxID=6941 RepID=A0A9J6DRQ2_RHIMP|nr:hypothetical protein HPB51_001154 [Rhipicephalus microplus]
MVVNNLLLALVCCALGSSQVAHLSLHKTKQPPTLPAPATTPASTVVTTEAPSANATITEDYQLTRKPQIGTWTAGGQKSSLVSTFGQKTPKGSGSNSSEPLRSPWSGTGESFWQVSGSGQSGSGWSSSANDTAGSGSGWGWGSSGNGSLNDLKAWGQASGFGQGNKWGAVKGQGIGQGSGWGGGSGQGFGQSSGGGADKAKAPDKVVARAVVKAEAGAAMVINKLLLALACCAVASPQVAQHLALHKTKRPTTLPAPARTLAATLGTTEAPSVNITVTEDYPLTREPQIGTWTAGGSLKSSRVSKPENKTLQDSVSTSSAPPRGPWNGTGESFWKVSGSGESGSGWSSSSNDTAGSGSGWGWGSSGNGDIKNGKAWRQASGFGSGNKWGAVKEQGQSCLAAVV